MGTAAADSVRAAAHLRISSDRTGEELGVTRQREDIRALVDGRGWTWSVEFLENDTSANGRRRRPRFEALLAAVRAGEVDVVVAWSLERLARAARERLALLEACRDAGVMLAFVRGSDIDPTTPAGRLTFGILGEVAQHEIDQKADRQRRATLQAAQQGRRVGGRRPFGYEQDGSTIRDNEAAALRRAYVDVIEGVSLARVARDWNAAGLRSGQRSWRPETKGEPVAWDSTTVGRVLRNARNAGIRAHRGEEIGPAAWPALVDVETYRAARAILDEPSRYRGGGSDKRQLLTGLALCGQCGATVHGGGATHGKPMYRCAAAWHMSRLRDPVDEYVTGVVLGVLERDGAALLVDHDRPDAAALRDEAAALRARMESLALEVADGAWTPAQGRAMNERLRGRLADVEARQADAGRASVLGRFVGARDMSAVWDAIDDDRRRAVIDAVAVVRLHPVGRGTRTFRPQTVEFEYRATARPNE